MFKGTSLFNSGVTTIMSCNVTVIVSWLGIKLGRGRGELYRQREGERRVMVIEKVRGRSRTVNGGEEEVYFV